MTCVMRRSSDGSSGSSSSIKARTSAMEINEGKCGHNQVQDLKVAICNLQNVEKNLNF